MVLSNPYEKQLGLSSRQVELKKAQGKQNIVLERAVKTTGQILKDNICTLFNLFNVLIAIALAFARAWSNMFFILVIAINILIGIIQELHARNLVEKLSLLSRPMVKVIRDGIVAKLPAQELVKEDVTELETGNQVCADSVILEGHVEVDESLLSGEADPVYKSPGERLLSGSFIVSGKCTARIEHVGIDNYDGRLLCGGDPFPFPTAYSGAFGQYDADICAYGPPELFNRAQRRCCIAKARRNLKARIEGAVLQISSIGEMRYDNKKETFCIQYTDDFDSRGAGCSGGSGWNSSVAFADYAGFWIQAFQPT